MKNVRVGFAMTGSFCTFKDVIPEIKNLKQLDYDITPIMSDNAFSTDTRFGSSEFFRNEIENICENKIIHTIAQAEPIGPKQLLDILVIAPCTGNTIGKLAGGIFDTSVTLAFKAHLRNNRPVLIAVSTNDALGVSAKNIGLLFNYKNIYFVPMRQDNPLNKQTSIVANFSQINDAIDYALQGKQLQPVLL